MENSKTAAEAILDAARDGDQLAIEVLSDAAYHIGRGVAILLHLLNPGLIVISGRGARAGKMWVAPIQHAVNLHSIPKIAEHTEIKVSALHADGEITGAACLVMEHFAALPWLRNQLTPLKKVG